jgi:hypothetical protein
MAGDARSVERHCFLQDSADRLNYVAMHLMPHASRIDDQSAILRDHHSGDANVPGDAVHRDFANPRHPCGPIPWESAVDVASVGRTASLDHVGAGIVALERRPGLPSCALRRRAQDCRAALVGEVPEAELDRVRTGGSRQLVHERFVRKDVGHRRHAAEPGGADRRAWSGSCRYRRGRPSLGPSRHRIPRRRSEQVPCVRRCPDRRGRNRP